MKYHIDTIPVWDALRKGEPCFLCTLSKRAEATWAERFLGGSVMEPEWRIQVNAHGFCARHHQLLYSMGNRLGHALMLESHLHDTHAAMSKLLAQTQSAAEAMDTISPGKRGKARDAYAKALDGLETLSDDCILCAHIAEDMASSVCSVLHLWKNDSEFRAAMGKCGGFCLPHLKDLLRLAPDMLSGKELPAFTRELSRMEEARVAAIREDVSWFIKKFDYRFHDEPWKNAKNAVPRAVNALRGRCLADDAEGS